MAAKKVLFINPNRFRHPPVIPIGIEYLVHALRECGMAADVLDLCFFDNPSREIISAVTSLNPDAVCVTIRNIDSALFLSNEFFLPDIREHIRTVRRFTSAPVIIGGTGLAAAPQAILNYTGADAAVLGPGEKTLPALLEAPEVLIGSGRVVRGTLPSSACAARGIVVPYAPYIAEGGVPGFETHKGCTSYCGYCIEAGTSVAFKDPAHVLGELRQLAGQGHDHLHLCDAEFNEDLDYCTELLEAMIASGPALRWALYMRPGIYNKRLFSLLKKSGAYLITLSVDTWSRCPEYWQDVETMVFLAKRAGIRISIDFLAGFPYESDDDINEALDLFRRVEPDEVVVNVFIRLYESTKMRALLARDPALVRHCLSLDNGNGSFLTPCFFNRVPLDRLREMLGADPLFRIAGEEKVVNYQKAAAAE